MIFEGGGAPIRADERTKERRTASNVRSMKCDDKGEARRDVTNDTRKSVSLKRGERDRYLSGIYE